MFLIGMGSLTYRSVTNLIREHVKFVREYLLISKDLDKAYYSWISRRRKDIRLLNALVNFP
mgnify:CR=1 FL=1